MMAECLLGPGFRAAVWQQILLMPPFLRDPALYPQAAQPRASAQRLSSALALHVGKIENFRECSEAGF